MGERSDGEARRGDGDALQESSFARGDTDSEAWCGEGRQKIGTGGGGQRGRSRDGGWSTDSSMAVKLRCRSAAN